MGSEASRPFCERLADRFGWQPKRERGRIIALTGRDANITVEPGGQLELSGEQCASIHCAHRELIEHIKEIVTVGADLGIVFLGLGIQPMSSVDQIEWVPKRRYAIMGPYMAQVGSLGQRMMKQTATVQANFDFGDESDAMRKFRVAMGLVPLISAMFANSSISEGRANGFMTLRGHIWTDTDSRTIRVASVRVLTRRRYRRLRRVRARRANVLHPPQWRIRRNPSGRFGNSSETDGHGERATLDDWALHLHDALPGGSAQALPRDS